MMEPNKRLDALGVSFRNAPAAVRERLSFSRSEAAALLRQAAAEAPGTEAMILSTCNRTEFYLAAPQGSDAVENWLARLRRWRPDAPIGEEGCLRYTRSGSAAARHLFRVACGLDSAVLGDTHILGQVKEGLAGAAESGTVGTYLNRLMGQAIHAGKRARTETRISRGAASTGSAVVGMLCARYRQHPGTRAPHLLVIGAGKLANDIGRHAAKRWRGTISFVNRSEGKAEELARRCGGNVFPWSGLHAALREADVVVAATAASQPILRREELEPASREREGRPLLVVDAGLPRNVETDSSVEIVDIDSIQEQQGAVLALRQSGVPAVEQIVEEEVRAWEQWEARRPVERLIHQLYQEAGARSHEILRLLPDSKARELHEFERLCLQSFKKLLHHHVRRLRNLPLASAVTAASEG